MASWTKSKSKETVRDPSPKVRKFFFWLSGSGGFAVWSSAGVIDVDGRGENGVVWKLRAEAWERRSAGQVTPAAPLGHRGSRQRLTLLLFLNLIFLKKQQRDVFEFQSQKEAHLVKQNFTTPSPTRFLKLFLSLSREGGCRLDFWASWALALWALESRRPVSGTRMHQSGPETHTINFAQSKKHVFIDKVSFSH